MTLLHYDFMRNALLAALLVGVTAPVMGIYLVQRRLSLIGDGLGHVALTGVAVGVLTGTAPVSTALVCTVLAALAIELIRDRGRANADVALAIMFYGGIAGGVVLISRSSQGTSGNLSSYLFGSLITTTTTDLVTFAALAAVVLVATTALAPRLFAVSSDEEFARAAGLPVLGLNMLLSALTAATVVISMRVVGLLLISALMIVPNAVAQLVAPSFRIAMLLAIGIGVTTSTGGTVVSFYADTPSGATIVLLTISLFATVALGVGLRDTVHTRRRHGDDRRGRDHLHEHGPGCGHETIPHGDHLDYVHDGHRHAVHRGHYDDH